LPVAAWVFAANRRAPCWSACHDDGIENGHRRTPALDIAVVGGGMVGAAAALALSRAGFSTALLEARAPAPWSADDDVDLRVVGLAPSSIALLDDLGVWPSIRDARASSYSHMHVWDAENGAAIHFDAADEGRDSLGYIVENNLVQWTLWQSLEAAGVHRLCPATVKDFETRADRVVLELGRWRKPVRAFADCRGRCRFAAARTRRYRHGWS
jgi:2-octaprenylphenol hydroxylase